ncbi:hypothetical protein GR223_20830 [Rhizobium leguminosarum]|uniref:hypothetical protein n=1 Tax=Rhizobium ruizarguesonis TaxID=2081791 RepID=UPI0013E0C70B|nr:hypothetical protein [Rhizobium ruizarguesonis]NEJ88372.1 hypothetical protein [Rhizobium ruizarguesonis]
MSSSRVETTTFLVLFQSDINRGHMCNYDDIQRELQRLGNNMVEFRADTWFFESQFSADKVITELRNNLSGAEALFIAALGSDVAHFGLLPDKIAAVARHSPAAEPRF